MATDEPEPRSLGWDAINGALKPIYGDQEPRHMAAILHYAIGGRDPLDGISIYRSERGGPHLHYVTYGFSELYEKESEDPATSGWGFELTFRLAHRSDGEPPGWPFSFLQNLARYVFQSGRVFGAGHSLPLNGPIALESDTKIWAIGFVIDPELGAIETPNGRVEFLQIVGLTLDEFSAVQSWDCRRFLDLVRDQNEFLVTNTSRDSYLQDPGFSREVVELTKMEGASSGALFCNHARIEGPDLKGSLVLALGATVADDLGRRLGGRIPFGRPFSIFTQETEIRFEAGDEFESHAIETGHAIQLNARQVDALIMVLRPQAATHRLAELPQLTVVVEKSEIKDADGKVVQVIG